MIPTVLAFDPGLDGAIATLHGPTITAVDMPTLGTGRHRHVDVHAVIAAITDAGPVDMVVIEEISTRPGLASNAVLKTGRGWGVIYGALVALERPVTVVRPEIWKRALGIPKGAAKDASRERAMQLWPDRMDLFARVRDHGRAEACLMARWWLERPYNEETAA